jgi:hypothetical protein
MTAARNSSEPDGKNVPELCMVANQTATYDAAYGWADVNCNNKFVFMCRVIREWHAAIPARPVAGCLTLCASWFGPAFLPPNNGARCSNPAAPGLYYYASNATKNTYVLNTNQTSQKDAQAKCSSLGGNLVSWSSYTEQLEVEQYYIKQGFLMPVFHKNYWVGLKATSHPSFKWMDPWAKGPSPSTYQHWGSDGSSKEPNNQSPPEFCAVGNFTQRYDNVWGWADARCSGSYTSMCIIRPLCTVQPPPYTTNTSKATFELVLCNYTWDAAEKACNARAGHLANYVSSGEQAEVEKYYTDNGYLLPTSHKAYWFGLRTTADTWPSFTWVDKTVKLPITYRCAPAGWGRAHA